MNTTPFPCSLASGELLSVVRGGAGVRHFSHVLAVAIFLCLSGLMVYRITGRFDFSQHSRALGYAHADFRDGIYYPVVSFLQGRNPYDSQDFLRIYPVKNSFPPYLPLTLIYHLPLGFLSFTSASYVYLMLMFALVPVLAYLTLRLCGLATPPAWVFGLAVVLLLSRPGYWTLYLGQYSVTMAVAVYLALIFRRSGWATLGITLAAMKPSYGVPLALLMLASGRESWRPVIRGGLYASAISVAAVAVILYHVGADAFLGAATTNFDWFGVDPEVNPATSSYRIDAVALLARWLGHPLGLAGELAVFAGVMALSAVVLWRLRNREMQSRTQLSAGLICLAILACTYHQSYDVLLLAAPLTALVGGRWAPPGWARTRWRWFLVAMLAIPAFNYLNSEKMFEHIGFGGASWRLLSSLNGLTLLIAFLTYAAIAWRVSAGGVERGTVCVPQP